MKKRILLILFSFVFIFGTSNRVSADSACTEDTVKQVAKIVYHEVGGDIAVNSDENFFMQMNTGAILLNVTMLKSGDTLYNKMLNLTNNNYQGYTSYRDVAFEESVPRAAQGKMLYIASLVLNGKYTLPKNMIYQAACSCILGKNASECQGVDTGLPACPNETRLGVIWTIVKTKSGFYDLYFGYDINSSSLASTDIFGNTISDTSVTHYKDLARRYESMGNDSNIFNTITPSNACNGESCD